MNSADKGIRPSPKAARSIFDGPLRTALWEGWNDERVTTGSGSSTRAQSSPSVVIPENTSSGNVGPLEWEQWDPAQWDKELAALVEDAAIAQPPESMLAPSAQSGPSIYNSRVLGGTSIGPLTLLPLDTMDPREAPTAITTQNDHCNDTTQRSEQSQAETYTNQMIMCASLNMQLPPNIPLKMRQIVTIVGPDYRELRRKIKPTDLVRLTRLDDEFEALCVRTVEESCKEWEVRPSV